MTSYEESEDSGSRKKVAVEDSDSKFSEEVSRLLSKKKKLRKRSGRQSSWMNGLSETDSDSGNGRTPLSSLRPRNFKSLPETIATLVSPSSDLSSDEVSDEEQGGEKLHAHLQAEVDEALKTFFFFGADALTQFESFLQLVYDSPEPFEKGALNSPSKNHSSYYELLNAGVIFSHQPWRLERNSNLCVPKTHVFFFLFFVCFF